MKRPYGQGGSNQATGEPAVGHINPNAWYAQQQQQQPGTPAPPLPPGPPPPAAPPAQAPNAYAGYSYPGYASAAPSQAAAHPQYPGYGYGGATQQQQHQAYYGQAGANSAYAQHAAASHNNAAAYAAYYGTQQQPPQAAAGPAAYAGYLPPAQQAAHPAPPYAAPTYNAAGGGAFPPQPGLSPQGAPPYKRTRYDSMSQGGPPPPNSAGLPPPPPALPPVGAGRAGPPPSTLPPASRRGPPSDVYDNQDRYRGPPQHSPRAGSSYAGARDRYAGPPGHPGSAGGGRPPRPRDGYDSRPMPPPSGGRGPLPPPPPPYRGAPPASSGPVYGSVGPRGSRGPPGARHDRDRGGNRGSGPRDGYRDSRRDDRGGRAPVSAAGGAKGGPRSTVNRKEPRRERRWGSKDGGKDLAPGGKDESKTFLTDFRISSLSIAELDWVWKTEQDALETSKSHDAEESEKPMADEASDSLEDTAAADMSVDTIAPIEDAETKTTEADAAAPVKKPSKRQRRAAAKRAAAAAAAAKVETETAGEDAATTAEVKDSETAEDRRQEESADKEDTQATAAAAPAKKDGKHGRDEDGEGEADTDAGVVAAKKVKAESGEAVEVKVEAAAASADASGKAVDASSVVTDNKDELQKAATALAQRENSRLRIYFSSPVSSTSAHADKKSVAASDAGGAEPTQAIDAAKVAPVEAQTDAAPASAQDATTAVNGAAQDAQASGANGVLASTGPGTGYSPKSQAQGLNEPAVTEIDGEPLDGEPVSGQPDDAADDDSDGESLRVESTLLTSSSTVTAPTVESDNSSYPPDPYSQGPQPPMSREHSLAPTDAAHHQPPEPSADRISISYARNTRRIVIDAQVIDKVLINRADGRVELDVQLKPAVNATDATAPDEYRVCEGILIEALDPESDDFYVLDRFSLEQAWLKQESDETQDDAEHSVVDALMPPLHRLLNETIGAQSGGDNLFKREQIKIVAHLDRANPLTEARWVKTGEVEQWIISLGLTNGQDPRKDKLSEWRGKIVVADPDAPPTIEHTLKSWATSSTVGNFDERKKFVETHMADIDNVVEILLRLTRGDRSGPSYSNAASASQANSVGVLAATLSAPYPDSQTQVSLAVLAMFRLSVETAERAGLDKKEVHKQVSEIVRNVPFQLQHKALDGMFKEYRSGRKA
ncbi:hypothetical protein ACM66B_005930 [Microbotryomycetes sp. NB124-2]